MSRIFENASQLDWAEWGCGIRSREPAICGLTEKAKISCGIARGEMVLFG